MNLIRHHAGLQVGFKKSFTLVELLTVMAIIALMVAIAGPSMKMMRGNAVKSGSSQFASTLSLARARALTDRTHVRIVFAEPPDTNYAAQPYTTYAVLVQTNRTSNAAASWVYVSGWNSLPPGAYFSVASLSALNNSSPVPFPTNSGNPTTSIPCIELKATGVPTTAVSMNVTEGTVLVLGGSVAIVNSNAANTIKVSMETFLGRITSQ